MNDIDLLRLLIGDVPANIFYPIFADEQLQQILDYADGDIKKAARMAATSAAYIISTISYREKVGEVEVWTNAGRDYLAVLKEFMNDNNFPVAIDAIPYAAGISAKDMCDSFRNWDSVKSCLVQVPNSCLNRRWCFDVKKGWLECQENWYIQHC